DQGNRDIDQGPESNGPFTEKKENDQHNKTNSDRKSFLDFADRLANELCPVVAYTQNDIRRHIFLDLVETFIHFIGNFDLVTSRLSNHRKIYRRNIILARRLFVIIGAEFGTANIL